MLFLDFDDDPEMEGGVVFELEEAGGADVDGSEPETGIVEEEA